MKKYLFLICLTSFGIVKSQISEVNIKNSVDFVNCKVVEYSLLRSKSKGVFDPFKKKCNCADNPNFKLIRTSIELSEKVTIQIAEQIESIKEDPIIKRMSKEEFVTLLSNDIFEKGKYNYIHEFATDKNIRGEKFDEFKSKLHDQLAIQIQSFDETLPNKKTYQDSVIISNVANKPSEEHIGWFEGYVFEIDILSIIISVSLTLFIIWYLNKRSIKRETDPLDKQWVMKLVREEFQLLQNKITALEKLNERNSERNAPQIQNLRTNSIPAENIEKSTSNPIQNLAPTPLPFYLSNPNPDGSFNDSSASVNYKEGASLYVFTLIEAGKASFQLILTEGSIKLALKRPEVTIDPVCDVEGAFSQSAKGIKNLQPGIAKLINGKWEVEKSQKAIIKYES